MKSIILFLFISLSVFLLSGDLQSFPAPAKCAIPQFEQALEQAAAVFVGKVVSQKSEGQLKIFEFEVAKFWKGVDKPKVTVYVNQSMRYESQFEVGKSYLVFAEADEYDETGSLFDRRCSRSKPIDNDLGATKQDLEKLGEAKSVCDLET